MSLAFAITNAWIRNEKARSDYAPSPNPQVLSERATSCTISGGEAVEVSHAGVGSGFFGLGQAGQ